MSTSTSKLVVVIGATGVQGGSVINSFLSEPTWRVRGITRNVASEKAQSLISQGVEMVAADLDQPQSLVDAFRDATAIFSVTDYWNAAMNPQNQTKLKPNQSIFEWTYEYEVQQGKNIFDAAARTPTLERLVVSSLADCKKWSNGKYSQAYHFDSKAHAVEYGKTTYPELWAKTSTIQIGWYLSNWLGPLRPIKDANGSFTFAPGLPATTKVPMVATEEDTGPLVKVLIESASPGKNLIAYREYIDLNELIRTWSDVVGVPAVYSDDSPPLPSSVQEGYNFWTEFGYEARADETVVHPRDVSVSAFLAAHELD